jgi:hypothetical protein
VSAPADGAGTTGPAPALLLVKGDATDEELAAVVAVLQAYAASAAVTAAEPRRAPASSWSAPVRRLRVTHPPGPGGWRAGGLPR